MADLQQIRKTPQWELLELRHGKSMGELFEEGVREGKSMRQLAWDWGISINTLGQWTRLLGYREAWVRPDGTAVR